LHWSANSQKVYWTLGDEYFSNDLKNRFKFVEGAPATLPAVDSVGTKIGLKIKADLPNGRVAFKGARLVTMEGDQVIEDGTIVINQNKIETIGKSAEVTIPPGTKIIEARGKTIVPGFIDSHAHIGNFREGLSPQKH